MSPDIITGPCCVCGGGSELKFGRRICLVGAAERRWLSLSACVWTPNSRSSSAARGGEEMCCYTWVGSSRHSRETGVLRSLINRRKFCWGIKFHFTVAVKWNGLQWRQILFNYSLLFTTLNCSAWPVAFSISSVCLQITQRTSAAVMVLPRCLLSLPFPFPASGISGEAHLFHMALGAIISSISVTSFIMREASDAQHFSLGLEQSPDHSLWPVLQLTHTHRASFNTRTSKRTTLKQHVLK